MIVTQSPSKRYSVKGSPIGTSPKSGAVGSTIQLAKIVAKTYGFYKDVEPYLPDKYIEKAQYAPRKRLSGYVGGYVHAKKKRHVKASSKSKTCQFNQKYCV